MAHLNSTKTPSVYVVGAQGQPQEKKRSPWEKFTGKVIRRPGGKDLANIEGSTPTRPPPPTSDSEVKNKIALEGNSNLGIISDLALDNGITQNTASEIQIVPRRQTAQQSSTSRLEGTDSVPPNQNSGNVRIQTSGESVNGVANTGNVPENQGPLSTLEQLLEEIEFQKRETEAVRKMLNEEINYQKSEVGRVSRELTAEVKTQEAEVKRLHMEHEKALTNFNELNTNYTVQLSDMQKKNTALRNAKLELQTVQGQLDKSLETEAGLRGNLNVLNVSLQSAHDEQERLRLVETRYNSLKVSHTALKQRKLELEETERSYHSLSEKFTTMSSELTAMRLESKSKLGDDFFIHEWKNLQTDVKSWADKYFWGREVKTTFVHRPYDVQNFSKELLKLSKDAQDLLLRTDGGWGTPLVAQAYLWKVLEGRVFDGNPVDYSGGFFWAQRLRSEFSRMEGELRPEMLIPAGKKWDREDDTEFRIFCKWKASTSKLLVETLIPPSNPEVPLEQRRIPVDDKLIDDLVMRAHNVLDPYFNSDNIRGCETELRAIFRAAIDLDSHMHEQWSLIYPLGAPIGETRRFGFPFNPTTMEPFTTSHPLNPNDPVGMVISPALVRRGTSKGDQYGKHWVLVNSRVMPQRFLGNTTKPKTLDKSRRD